MTYKELMILFISGDYSDYLISEGYHEHFVTWHLRTLLALAEQERLTELYTYLHVPEMNYFTELTELFPDMQ